MTSKFILFTALLTIVCGLLVLIGWTLDIPTLKSILPIWVSMKVNTALCFMLIGIAILLLDTPTVKHNSNFSYAGRFCSLLVGFIGLLTLSEYLFNWDLGIDQLLFYEPANTVGTSYAGRMAPETALCFVLLALAIWIADVWNDNYGNTLMSIGLLILTSALSAIASYFVPSLTTFGWFGFTIMAVHTAILFALLGTVVIAISWRRDSLSKKLKTSSYSVFQRNAIILDTGVVTIVLVTITSALVILLQLRQVAEARNAVVTQNLAKTLELSIEGLIDKIAVAIQAAADDITLHKSFTSTNLINQHISLQKMRLPEVDYLYGINEAGDIIYGTDVPEHTVNVADRSHFIALRDTPNHHLITTTAVMSRTTSEWIWLVACRVNKPDGSFGGIVSAAIVLNNINNLFSLVHLSKDDSIALRDLDLGLIARYPMPETANLAIGSKHLSEPFLKALKANPFSGTYISGMTSIDHISRTHSYRKNTKYGFLINIGLSSEAALAEWHKQVSVITCLVSVFTITLIAFSKMIKRAWVSQEQDVMSLKISQKFLHKTQKIARLGNYTYDVQTNLWTSSDILDDIFGIDEHYLRTGETWLALVVPELRAEMADYLKNILEQHLPFDHEYQIERVCDDQRRWVYGKGRLQFDNQGNPICLIGTIQDITERKLAEIEIKLLNAHLEERVRQRTNELETVNQSLLIAKEAAEAANIAKSTFIATMSHELRTPLNAILGFSELMSLDADATAKQKETLGIINRSGTHLLGMINDVLDISKIEAGRLELDLQAFDLLKLLHDVGDMINVRALSNHLNFSLEIAEDLQQFVKADKGKLQQILINLLGNAIKFTKQGAVILRANSQLLDSTTALLTVEVIDSGVGIPADKIDNLFNPFVQLMQANSDTQGTGLGLAISKSLIELMKGTISASSEFGEGSIFKIELPVELATSNDIVIEENYRAVKSLAPNQPNWRLLVVDDNSDNRLLLVAILTGIGFQVREAENGQEAIHVFEQWQPHLIWMDMRMPVMDGYEAASRIRQLTGGDRVKIIALTASAFIEEHRKIVKTGCDTVIHKPFHLPEIFATLTKYLGVQFIYQDVAETVKPALTLKITAEMVETLPLELRQHLHEASLKLDIEEIDMVIAKIRPLSAEIAGGLETLAKNYQFEQLVQFTNTAI